MAEDEIETTEILVCGCGPTGALLSALLGQLGVNNICLDREDAIATDPRGIALDEDGIRVLQSIGIDTIYSEIGRCLGTINMIGGVHSDFSRKPFMRLDYGTSGGGTGHVGFICHKQPILEKNIRRKIEDSPYSQLRTSCTLSSIDEDSDWVYATYINGASVDHKIRAKFLVGCDGKTGFTRKKYLEPKGVLMQPTSEIGAYAETWVAMNFRLTLPNPDTHPDFPLWRQKYTPEQVYNLFFPQEFQFLCNPNRPAICGRFGLEDDRLWRFEYVVQDGENGEEMASNENIRRIVHPYLRHSGTRYGLGEEVSFPEDCIEVLRARPFFFSARSCNVWAMDRVLLCGDAAHVFPPYGGQGIVSGFRDATELAWRLKLACQSLSNSHGGLFEGWYRERKQQLDHSLAATVENGRKITERNPMSIFLRDTYLSLVQLIPSWKRWLEQGGRRNGMCRYTYSPGLHFISELDGGLLLPQVYARSLLSNGSDVIFTDDMIFAPDKEGLFQLVVLLDSTAEISAVFEQLQSLDINGLSNNFVKQSECVTIVQDLEANLSRSQQTELEGLSSRIVRVASDTEFTASTLCKDRPEPRYYDAYRIRKEVRGGKFVLVRPDRFVFAACKNMEELGSALRLIEPTLAGIDKASTGPTVV